MCSRDFPNISAAVTYSDEVAKYMLDCMLDCSTAHEVTCNTLTACPTAVEFGNSLMRWPRQYPRYVSCLWIAE